MKEHKFKDKCDGCYQMKVCKGYGNKVLCADCINQEKKIEQDNKKGESNEQARFAS